MLLLFRCGLWALVFAVGTTVVKGAEVSFELRGRISVADGTVSLPANVFVGAPFVSTLKYDLTAPDLMPDDPNQAQFLFTPAAGIDGLSFTVGPLTFYSPPGVPIEIGVFNDVPHWPLFPDEVRPPADYFFVSSQGFLGDLHGSYSQFGLAFVDPTGIALSSDELPALLVPASFEMPGIGVSDNGPCLSNLCQYFTLGGYVTELHAIPEPDSVALLGLSLALIYCGTLHQRRSNDPATGPL